MQRLNSSKNAYDRNYRNDMDVRSRWAGRSFILQVQVIRYKYKYKIYMQLIIADWKEKLLYSSFTDTNIQSITKFH